MSPRRVLQLLLLLPLALRADPAAEREAVRAETLRPYDGPVERGVDTSTLAGKLMAGYQGWFNAEGDGAGRGWNHWSKDRKAPGPANIRVDLWPDLSEFGPGELFPSDFTRPDGTRVPLFSSFRPETVLRHFAWMREYGLHGAFVQRFPVDLGNPKALRHNNTVLAHCREGANRNGRAYALMYDLTGLRSDQFAAVKDDWRSLRTRMRLTEDPAYLRHRGQPLLAVWGVGFNDRRAYTLEDCRDLLRFFREDPDVGGCALMVGVPTHWRTLDRDAVPEPALLDLLKTVQVISPWSVGRHGTPDQARRYAEKTLGPDRNWARTHGPDLLPVVFPGFSWHNMKGDKLDAIPRLDGAFFQAQIDASLSAGDTMLYVAMFDEVDEATAIFKIAPPPSPSFVTPGAVPSDHYLRLAGQAARRLESASPGPPAAPPGSSP